MTKYKKGDVILAVYGDIPRGGHITLLKLLKDPKSLPVRWSNYMLVQINHDNKIVTWPRHHTDMRFEPERAVLKFTTDIESIVNFKKDYVKTVFESGYKRK